LFFYWQIHAAILDARRESVEAKHHTEAELLRWEKRLNEEHCNESQHHKYVQEMPHL